NGYFTDGVVFEDIINTSSGCGFPGEHNFTDYTNLGTHLAANTTYPITLTADGSNGMYFAAMIDFNLDLDFDDAGEFFAIGYANAGASVSGDIVVPASIATGTTTLRILSRSGTDPLTQALICNTFDHGEVEDYSVIFYVPSCTSLLTPLHASTNVPLTSALTWEPAMSIPAVTGYRLDVGTTTGGTQILNNFDVGNVTTYNPPGDFTAGSNIFVTIRPYNATATAGCPEESFVTSFSPLAITCLPTFQLNCSSSFRARIESVIFHTIDNQNTGCANPGSNNYSNYTAISTNLEKGTTYPITLRGANGINGQYFAVLFDFNQDQFFSEDEFFNLGWAPRGSSLSSTVTVPASAAIGTARMRVFTLDRNVPIKFSQVCGTSLPEGEVEEYSINIFLPDCSSLSSPTNGSTNVPVTDALTWLAATGDPAVEGYRLDVGTTPGGTDILDNFDAGNAITFNPPGDFPYNSTIYVTVTPYNGNGDALACTETSFTTEQAPPPACTNLTSPANGATNVAVTSALIWAAAAGSPTGYRLNVGTTSSGTDILNNFDAGNVTSYNPPGDFPFATQIFVKITPYNATGDASGCPEESFTTQIAPPACTNLTSPANGATNVAVTSALNWAAATGSPTGYRLNVGTTSGGTDILNNFDAGNVTTYDPPGDFPYGVIIYVKITPYNGTGDASGCSEESFTTRICIPNLTLENLTIPSGTYWSEGELTSGAATIASGSIVIFKSDTSILLEQDFTVELGGILEAVIEACPVNFGGIVAEEK
ncbi:MAG: Ig-like domain-containing protein, partial [Bacteroidota bacterium]